MLLNTVVSILQSVSLQCFIGAVVWDPVGGVLGVDLDGLLDEHGKDGVEGKSVLLVHAVAEAGPVMHEKVV